MNSGLDEVLRVEGGRVLATLIRMTGDFGVAEDAVQEATLEALTKWESDMPKNPSAWLTTVAKHKALDRLRRESQRTDRETESVRLLDQTTEPEDGVDDRLRLIFTCCHPALNPDAQVALTLRTICGLTTPEIAQAFLVSEATMGQRISRAKRKIKVAAIPYRVPSEHEMPDRLAPVLAVLYLVFTTGHHAPRGQALERVDLVAESMRLARMLTELMPDEPEAHGLLGLLLATAARLPGRTDSEGNVLLIPDQDRSRWDLELSAEAEAEVERAFRAGSVGPYAVQGAISLAHTTAATYDETDWSQILALYRALEQATDSPVVKVNRAIAESKVEGFDRALDSLDTVSGVETWHLYWSTKAAFLSELERHDEAVHALKHALTCEMNDDDRVLLESRLATELGRSDRR